MARPSEGERRPRTKKGLVYETIVSYVRQEWCCGLPGNGVPGGAQDSIDSSTMRSLRLSEKWAAASVTSRARSVVSASERAPVR
ncbi:hypothetical protein M2284_001331 [Rhodococcus sp. LBL1]|nr:hypothetical protein [Rhodococcus sp. LBL1]MDH6682574.1 hypothetical protein [Rhodococcus sp. LBL2]